MQTNGDQVRPQETLEAECARLRQELQAQQERLRALSAENDHLRREQNQAAFERDRYAAALLGYKQKEVVIDEAAWAAEYAEAKQAGADFTTLVREVEGILDRKRPEPQHDG